MINGRLQNLNVGKSLEGVVAVTTRRQVGSNMVGGTTQKKDYEGWVPLQLAQSKESIKICPK